MKCNNKELNCSELSNIKLIKVRHLGKRLPEEMARQHQGCNADFHGTSNLHDLVHCRHNEYIIKTCQLLNYA